MSEQLSRAFIVTGRVQGVGFRWWTQREAERLGVGGTVRNRADGAVEVALAGAAAALEEMREKLVKGPPAARVDEVREVDAHGDVDAGTFRIVR